MEKRSFAKSAKSRVGPTFWNDLFRFVTGTLFLAALFITAPNSSAFDSSEIKQSDLSSSLKFELPILMGLMSLVHREPTKVISPQADHSGEVEKVPDEPVWVWRKDYNQQKFQKILLSDLDVADSGEKPYLQTGTGIMNGQVIGFAEFCSGGDGLCTELETKGLGQEIVECDWGDPLCHQEIPPAVQNKIKEYIGMEPPSTFRSFASSKKQEHYSEALQDDSLSLEEPLQSGVFIMGGNDDHAMSSSVDKIHSIYDLNGKHLFFVHTKGDAFSGELIDGGGEQPGQQQEGKSSNSKEPTASSASGNQQTQEGLSAGGSGGSGGSGGNGDDEDGRNPYSGQAANNSSASTSIFSRVVSSLCNPFCNWARDAYPERINGDAAKRPEYRFADKRRESFQQVGNPFSHGQRTEDAVKAGLYYAGTDDHVRCYFCGGGLRYFKSGETFIKEHAGWFPKCEFIRKKCGEDFVNEARKEKQEETRKKKNASQNAQEDEGNDDAGSDFVAEVRERRP